MWRSIRPLPSCLCALALAALPARGAHLEFSSFLGGNDVDLAHAVATDDAGSVYVAGVTLSSDFPDPHVLPAGPRHEVFVVKLDSAGRYVWASRFGGSNNELPNGIAVGGSRVWVTGWTDSGDFPRIGALAGQPPTVTGDHDAFVTALDARDGSLLTSTNLGGSDDDYGEGIARIRVAGGTGSADFPVADPVLARCGLPEPDCADAFVAELRPRAAGIVWSTYLGGQDTSYAWGVAVDPRGNTWAAGMTEAVDFPQVDPLQPFAFGIADAWVAQLSAGSGNRPPDCTGAAAAPARLGPPNGKLTPVTLRGVTDPDGDRVTLTVTAILQDEPLSRKRQRDATGIGTARPQVRADRAADGDGRVYHLRFMAKDGKGGRCQGEVTVCVPRNQARKTCGDGGPLVDSAGGR